MKIKRILFKLSDLYMLLFNLLVISVFDSGGFIKYLFGAFLGIILLVMHKKIGVMPRLLLLITPYLFYISVGELLSIGNNALNKYCFEQPVLYLVPFFAALSVYLSFSYDINKFLILQFVAISGVFVWQNHLNGFAGDLWESKYAFIFGAYFIYFYYKKRMIFEGIAMLMLFLAHKRIALLAAIVVWITVALLKKIGNTKVRKEICSFGFVIFSLFMLMYVGIIRFGVFDRIIIQLGINTQGRNNIYNDVNYLYAFSPLFKGTGIGYVRVVLDEIGKKAFTLLHNDILAMYIEIGFWGFITFFVIYMIVFRYNSKYISNECIVIVILLYIYTFIIFMTDNISIYISYLYPFYMIIFALIGNGQNENGASKNVADMRLVEENIWEKNLIDVSATE